MLDCWRTGGANSPETFITAVAAILARYPDEVVYAVTNPTEGLPVQLTWMPSVKEVHDACEKAMEPIYRREREAKVVADLRAERASEPDKSDRPTREQLQAKYGENWGLESLAQPVRKPKPVPTADELREHYSKFNLGFQPKEGEQ
jgi:hypothetical protein